MKIKRAACRILLTTLLLGAICSLPGLADAGDAAHFLRDGLGARGRSMGSGYIGLADDYTAVFWNPAPSLQSPSTVLGGGLEQRNAGLFTFSTLGGWHATESWGGGAIVLTSDLYDVYQVAGGFRAGPVAAGLGVRSYQFGVPGDRGSGLGFDVGMRYGLELNGLSLVIAAVSRDVGWTPIRWGSLGALVVDRVAWVNRLGVGLAVPLSNGEWTVELDGELSTRRPPEDEEPDYWERSGELNLSLGTSFRWAGIVVRAGMQRVGLLGTGARLRPTVGIGVRVGGFAIDLALVPSPLGSTYLGGFEAEL